MAATSRIDMALALAIAYNKNSDIARKMVEGGPENEEEGAPGPQTGLKVVDKSASTQSSSSHSNISKHSVYFYCFVHFCS